MPPSCTVEQRNRVRAAATQLDADPRVLGVDVLDPTEGHREAWILEVTCALDASGVPPAVLRALAEHGLRVVRAGTRAGHYRAVARL